MTKESKERIRKRLVWEYGETFLLDEVPPLYIEDFKISMEIQNKAGMCRGLEPLTKAISLLESL